MKTLISPGVRTAFAVTGLILTAGYARAATTFPADEIAAFTDRHCSSCHNDVDKEGGLDLTSVQYTPENADNFSLWVKVHDRVQNGEMPPKEKKQPGAAEVKSFINGIATSLIASEKERIAVEGRTMRRRLNRSEYESIIRDVFQAPWLQVQSQLPEDGEAFNFNKVSTGLDVSYVHMQRYMSAADSAMRQLLAVKLDQPPTTTKRYYAREEGGMTQWLPNVNSNAGGPERMKVPLLGYKAQPDVRQYYAPATVGESDPATRELEASGWISSNYVTGFSSRWSNFRAPVAGRYHIKFSGFTFWAGPFGYTTKFANGRDMVGTPNKRQFFSANYDDISEGRRSEYVTIYTHSGPSNRRLGGIDLHPEVGVKDLGEVYLLPGEGIVTDASRFFRSRPTGFQGGYTNPLAQRDGAPGVAFRWMEIEGPLYDEATTAGYKLMFGDLPLKRVPESTVTVDLTTGSRPGAPRRMGGGEYGRGGGGPRAVPVEVESANPEQDAERLLRNFMARVYRRPVQEADVQLFLGVIKERLKAKIGFAGAMLVGYTAVLSSPNFVFVDEKPGRLDDYALATRLALFLWNSEPDAALRALATKGELHRPEVLKAQTERMLADPKSERFVSAFLDYWLEIRRIEETTPSTSLYNDYYLDEALSEAAVAESRLLFTELVQKNLPARNIVNSDFTFLNERLAAHYNIPGVEGIQMRRVALPADSVRGGFITQASVLKVTANGTTTSPVIRGKWIMGRIVGFEIPLPPAAVPAVEPDIRGAVTIRQQLDKHRADESCAMCHRKIDPPGFALENFDVMGAWRDRYRAAAIHHEPEHGFGKNGWPFAFYYALPVDASGQMADGRAFRDIRDFKQLLLKDEAQIARNITKQLAVYATGAPVRFGDRERVEQIVAATKADHYGVRSIAHQLVQSDLFLNK
jgi:hypothetical protein